MIVLPIYSPLHTIDVQVVTLSLSGGRSPIVCTNKILLEPIPFSHPRYAVLSRVRQVMPYKHSPTLLAHVFIPVYGYRLRVDQTNAACGPPHWFCPICQDLVLTPTTRHNVALHAHCQIVTLPIGASSDDVYDNANDGR